VSDSGAKTEIRSAGSSRRYFSASEKLRIVRAANTCRDRGEIGALLRREGIYSSQLTKWRRKFDEAAVSGMQSTKRGRKPRIDANARRIAELERANAKQASQLEMAHQVIELQKKASALLSSAFPTNDEKSS
tara:strand:+ start:119 stop:514 length:396 start_codon:yes stop_codon:yes gene_type:complete